MHKGDTELRPEPQIPRPERLDSRDPNYSAIMAAHGAAQSTQNAGYLDPFTGLFVMTANHHMERGWCCGRGCRHCPFA
jgi:hypothetical protein